jgi:hypothetical protein
LKSSAGAAASVPRPKEKRTPGVLFWVQTLQFRYDRDTGPGFQVMVQQQPSQVTSGFFSLSALELLVRPAAEFWLFLGPPFFGE